MTHPNKPADYRHQGRKDRLIREMEHDPYKIREKLPDPTVCPECKAVYHQGRWHWTDRPDGAGESLCPACQRVRDRCPAGFLTLGGPFFKEHREEILHRVRNVEAREKAEHPLERIMDVTPRDDGVEVTFTDIHVTRAAGEAVHDAYGGELDFSYADEEYLLRVGWGR